MVRPWSLSSTRVTVALQLVGLKPLVSVVAVPPLLSLPCGLSASYSLLAEGITLDYDGIQVMVQGVNI